jgi:hypothetical protein
MTIITILRTHTSIRECLPIALLTITRSFAVLINHALNIVTTGTKAGELIRVPIGMTGYTGFVAIVLVTLRRDGKIMAEAGLPPIRCRCMTGFTILGIAQLSMVRIGGSLIVRAMTAHTICGDITMIECRAFPGRCTGVTVLANLRKSEIRVVDGIISTLIITEVTADTIIGNPGMGKGGTFPCAGAGVAVLTDLCKSLIWIVDRIIGIVIVGEMAGNTGIFSRMGEHVWLPTILAVTGGAEIDWISKFSMTGIRSPRIIGEMTSR